MRAVKCKVKNKIFGFCRVKSLPKSFLSRKEAYGCTGSGEQMSQLWSDMSFHMLNLGSVSRLM